jgi:hypothetical protein
MVPAMFTSPSLVNSQACPPPPATPAPPERPPSTVILPASATLTPAVGRDELEVDATAVGAVAGAAHLDRAAAGDDLARDVKPAAAGVAARAARHQAASAGRGHRIAAAGIDGARSGHRQVAGPGLERDGAALAAQRGAVAARQRHRDQHRHRRGRSVLADQDRARGAAHRHAGGSPGGRIGQSAARVDGSGDHQVAVGVDAQVGAVAPLPVAGDRGGHAAVQAERAG